LISVVSKFEVGVRGPRTEVCLLSHGLDSVVVLGIGRLVDLNVHHEVRELSVLFKLVVMMMLWSLLLQWGYSKSLSGLFLGRPTLSLWGMILLVRVIAEDRLHS
jgi:hypothetical protein